MASFFSGTYKFLEDLYTIYIVTRKPGLPEGYSLIDMADDYATMIRMEFGEPVDVLGVSTGGSIAQHFAADHPDLVRKLIIHSSVYTLSDFARGLQLRIGHFARQRDWRAAYATLFGPRLSGSGLMKYALKPVVWLGALLMGTFGVPKDPNDLVMTIEAEDKHNFKDRLA